MAIQLFEEQTPYEDDRPEVRALERVTTQPHHNTRSRFGTHRPKKEEGVQKRRSILRRFQRPGSAHSGSDSKLGGVDGEDSSEQEPEKTEEQENGGRTLYFNRPLPPSARDEEGHPTAHYVRNKIQTAKYTPLTFIPKNLWFQFHNVANIYFLFIVILSVSLLVSVHLIQKLIYTDILNIWSLKSWAQRRTTYYHLVHHSHQRCHRGYSEDYSRQRAQQFSCA